MITRLFKIDKELIESCPKLSLIQRWGAGYDKVDVAFATERGIAVALAAGSNASAVSELAVLLMLAVYRRLVEADRSVHSGKWQTEGLLGDAMQIQGKTVGMLGFGTIARLTAKKVLAFGATVQYYDIAGAFPEDYGMAEAQYVSLEQLLKTSDIVSVHVPLSDATRNLIGRRQLECMKPGAILINTARGGIIDEDALADLLTAGHLRGAGLDTFATEPIDLKNRLLEIPTVICTPHLGGLAIEVNEICARHCYRNILNFYEHGEINARDLVNPEYKHRREM